MLDQEDRNLGTAIKGYRLIEYIASGDFGQIYRAQHVETARVAVVKLLTREKLLKERSELFCIDEGFLMSLSHPHLLPILDLRLHKDVVDDPQCQPYVITPYVSSGSLQRRMQQYGRKPFSVKETLAILVPVANALQYLHEQNVIHRGVQPGSILFDGEQSPQLGGLDIAIIDGSRSSWALGTKHYRAPEQFDGFVDKRSDQFALACIAYELLTGRHPFFSDSTLNPAKRLLATYTPVRDLCPEITERIEIALTKALSVDSNDRYSSIGDFITALGSSEVFSVEQQATQLLIFKSMQAKPAGLRMPEMGERFLNAADRTWITNIVETIVSLMSSTTGIRNLLRGLLPDQQINRINFRDGSQNIAENIIDYLEARGILNPPHQHSHALGAFLSDLIENDLVSYDAATQIVVLLFRYTLITDREKVERLSAQFQVRASLPTLLYE